MPHNYLRCFHCSIECGLGTCHVQELKALHKYWNSGAEKQLVRHRAGKFPRDLLSLALEMSHALSSKTIAYRSPSKLTLSQHTHTRWSILSVLIGILDPPLEHLPTAQWHHHVWSKFVAAWNLPWLPNERNGGFVAWKAIEFRTIDACKCFKLI